MAIELRMHDGEAVVAKVRPGVDDARTRLDDERRLLRELDLAGTVTPLEEEVTDEPALLLRPSGTATLASSAPTPADVRTIGASLADTLLGLHERGVTHGAIEPDHILWSPGRSPVLCGFGTATREGEPAEDIEALGRLLVALAPDEPTIAEAVEGSGGDLRRLRSSLGPSAASGPMLPPAAPRPAGGLPARPIGRERGPRGRWPVVVGAVLLIAALAGIGVLLVGRGSEPSASPAPSTTVTSTTPTTTAPTTTTTPPRAEQVWPAPNDCPAIGLGSGDRLGETDLDADGCPESVVRTGAELVVGRSWARAGSAGPRCAKRSCTSITSRA